MQIERKLEAGTLTVNIERSGDKLVLCVRLIDDKEIITASGHELTPKEVQDLKELFNGQL